MPNTKLTQIIERINSLDNLQATQVERTFSKSGFNSHMIYKITGVTVTSSTKGVKKVTNEIEIVYSMPVVCDSPVFTKNIKAAVAAEDTLIRNKINSPFNHSYLYRGTGGCLISEYTPHSDLFNFSESGKLYDYCSLENLRHLTAQVLLAVGAYHAKRLVHRDIKPENFLVYEQNGLYILKLCDHDDVIEVNNFGIAKQRPRHRVGSIEYRSPEYILDAHVLARMDYKANDCWAVGLTLKFILKCMLQQTKFQTMTMNAPGFAAQLVYLSTIIEDLTSAKPETRASIDIALQSLFFGSTESQRERYFHHVQASAKRKLSINGYSITDSNAKLDDPHYLLPLSVNSVYRSGTEVAHLIQTFYPSFDNFAAAKNTKYVHRQIKVAAKKHFELVAKLKKTSPSQKLLNDLYDFEVEYEQELNKFSQLFMRNLANSIKHVIRESAANYKDLMKDAAKRGLCPKQPTFFQRINYDDANEMIAKIEPETNPEEAFQAICDYIGDHRGFSEHSFKNILMKNLLHILHKSLNAMRNVTDSTAHVDKRMRR